MRRRENAPPRRAVCFVLGGCVSVDRAGAVACRLGPAAKDEPPRRAVCFVLGGRVSAGGAGAAACRLGPAAEEEPPRRAVCFVLGACSGGAAGVLVCLLVALEAVALLAVVVAVGLGFLVLFLGSCVSASRFRFGAGLAAAGLGTAGFATVFFLLVAGSLFSLVPVIVADASVGAVEAFFATRSFFVHSFFSVSSNLDTCGGTASWSLLTASNRRIRAVALVLDGGSP